jgi:hypothetical protein
VRLELHEVRLGLAGRRATGRQRGGRVREQRVGGAQRRVGVGHGSAIDDAGAAGRRRAARPRRAMTAGRAEKRSALPIHRIAHVVGRAGSATA